MMTSNTITVLCEAFLADKLFYTCVGQRTWIPYPELPDGTQLSAPLSSGVPIRHLPRFRLKYSQAESLHPVLD